MNALTLLGIAVLIGCSAFFSASEAAFTSVNALRLKMRAETGDAGARRAQKILSAYDDMLSTILAGNNLVNIWASSLTTMLAVSAFGEGAAGVSSLILTVVILVFGEISPKVLARQQSEKAAVWCALPLGALMFILRPLVRAVGLLIDRLAECWRRGEKPPSITEQEFAEILSTVEDEGVIDEDTGDLLQSALEFDEVTAEEAMTPRVELAAADADDPPEETKRLALESGYSRIPVYEGTIDNIIGILPVNAFLLRWAKDGTADVRSMLVKPLQMHKTMKLDDALNMMQRKHNHIAVVLDEYGGTLGLLTMEDVLEQIVGDIWDERDDIVLACEKVGEGVYEASGMMGLHDFFDEIDFDDRDFDSEYTTLGGWAVEMLDAQPAEGKSFAYKNLRVTVIKMDNMRVDRLRVSVGPSQDEERA